MRPGPSGRKPSSAFGVGPKSDPFSIGRERQISPPQPSVPSRANGRASSRPFAKQIVFSGLEARRTRTRFAFVLPAAKSRSMPPQRIVRQTGRTVPNPQALRIQSGGLGSVCRGREEGSGTSAAPRVGAGQAAPATNSLARGRSRSCDGCATSSSIAISYIADNSATLAHVFIQGHAGFRERQSSGGRFR